MRRGSIFRRSTPTRIVVSEDRCKMTVHLGRGATARNNHHLADGRRRAERCGMTRTTYVVQPVDRRPSRTEDSGRRR